LNDPNDPMSRTDDWDKDIRDPVSFDPTLTVARFVSATDETHTIGTLVNWADHPEVAHFSEADPATITAHYPHWLRESGGAGRDHGAEQVRGDEPRGPRRR